MSDPVDKRPEPVKPPASTRPSPAKPVVGSFVFVDYLGELDREGNRRPGSKLAAICAESKKLPSITIRPGLTVQDSTKWAAHCPATEKGDKPGAIRNLVDDGHLVVLKALPTDAAELLDLAARTQCPDALQVLIDHEAGRKPGADGKPRPRSAVLSALKAHKATADRRAKSPVAPGDQRRLAAKAKATRVLH